MIQVLMSTYNGMKYIGEQLKSIYEQSGVDVSLLVRDDGSTDETCALLDDEQAAGRLTWYTGENLGPAFSFWHLLQHAPESEFYAFCDQDDVWDKDKLSTAVGMLNAAGDAPALYFCQTRLVDSSLNEIPSVSISPLLTYGEALLYHFVTGCTVVMNNALRKELIKYTPSFMRMHDIWVYNVAQAIGARIFFDKTSHISYRQHSSNVIGQINSSKFVWKNRWKRLKKNECIRYRLALELLKGYGDCMSQENKELTELVTSYKNGFIQWCRLLFSVKFKCAPFSINLSSRIAVLFNIF